MAWKIEYLPQVRDDLKMLGSFEAIRILKVIKSRIENSEPDKSGKTLKGILSGCRKIRVGNTRIIYQVDKGRIRVLIIAVGIRRDNEVYEMAEKRV